MWKIALHILKDHMRTSWKKKFISIILFGFATAFLSVLEPILFTRIISQIENFYKTWIFDYNDTVKLIVVWSGFIIITTLFLYTYKYFFVYKPIMYNYVSNCKKFNKTIVHMWYAEYLWKKQGSLYKIYDRGTEWQEKFLYFFFGEALKNGASIIMIIIILLCVDVRMALLALSMMPVMILLGTFFIKKLSIDQRDLNDKWDTMYGNIGNILSSFMLTKILFLEKIFLRNMSWTLDKLYIDQNSLSKRWSFVSIYTAVLVMISRILVLGFGVYYVIEGTLSFASLFLVFSFIGWIYFPLSFLMDSLREMVERLTAVEKMYQEIGNIKEEDIYIWKTVKQISWSIQYQQVSFWYSKQKQILKDVSFSVQPWQKIALVGDTWAGKSTIVNLLLRFWDTTSGEILLDGQDITTIKKSSLRNHIGVVSQDNSLFNLSIEENLKFANPKATKKDLEVALKKAEATFVFDLPKWIKTVIGERGLKLSGWEKQRISIARLFLKNPEILILDEATSALDNKTEKLIQKSLDKLMKGKTSIIIAHRLSTIQHADCIYVLENGKIVESGNYEELMKKQKKFFAFANPDKLILG